MQRRCILWLPGCLKIMTLTIDWHQWKEYWFSMDALRRSTCHWISCSHCISSAAYSGDPGGRSCVAKRSLLWVRWKPDDEVDVDSGQAKIFLNHSMLIMVFWIWSSEPHHFMCRRSSLVRASTSGGKKVPTRISSNVCDEAPQSIHSEKGGTVGNVL